MMDLPGIFNPIHQKLWCLSDLGDSSFRRDDRCGGEGRYGKEDRYGRDEGMGKDKKRREELGRNG